MNATLERFGYPQAAVREFDHWVVLIRPVQSTPLSCVIAARSAVTSLGALTPVEFAELPIALREYEATVKSLAGATKFNYLALMMVDPNPHFHAIPRYASPASIDGRQFVDARFPRPPDALQDIGTDPPTREKWRRWLEAEWLGARPAI